MLYHNMRPVLAFVAIIFIISKSIPISTRDGSLHSRRPARVRDGSALHLLVGEELHGLGHLVLGKRGTSFHMGI